MERIYENELERSRSENLKMLGFLCYNRCVDGMWAMPDINAAVERIKRSFNYYARLRSGNANQDELPKGEITLNEQITELGCICYNHYVDNSIFDGQVMYLCKTIADINSKMTARHAPSGADLEDKLQVDCPYGMEPIPMGYVQCACGYRNRADARYCAKCGTRLRM